MSENDVQKELMLDTKKSENMPQLSKRTTPKLDKGDSSYDTSEAKDQIMDTKGTAQVVRIVDDFITDQTIVTGSAESDEEEQEGPPE